MKKIKQHCSFNPEFVSLAVQFPFPHLRESAFGVEVVHLCKVNTQ